MGALGHNPDALAGVLATLDPGDFYSPHRAIVWAACRRLSAERQPLEPTVIARALAKSGEWGAAVRKVVQVEMAVGSPASHAQQHADTVTDLHRRRLLLRAMRHADQVIAEHPGDWSDALSAVRASLDETAPEESDGRGQGPMGWDALLDEFETVHAPGGSRPGIPSPWWELDQILGGLFGGRVYVFAGRPGSGKSTAALQCALHAAVESGKESFVVSKEMPSVDVTGRFLAAGAEVSLLEINARRISDMSMARIREYAKKVGRPPITVDAKPRTLSGIKTMIRGHHHRHGLDVLVVDYVQLVRTDTASRTREQEVAEVSRQLKELAMELDIAVILPAQLNRESTKRADGIPTIADLRDSGQLEQDADAIILLHRPPLPDGQPSGQISLIVGKNRHGPTAEVSLRWQGGYGVIG
jgi:replicative DNA helicase